LITRSALDRRSNGGDLKRSDGGDQSSLRATAFGVTFIFGSYSAT